MNSLCVFCGSSTGFSGEYVRAAEAFGRLLATRGVRVVYGGGSVGVMAALADAALSANGEVIGVIPQHLLAREVGHTALSDLRVVSSMHERKALMAELADGFVALPGGIGTMEEFFEVWTWGQLGLHAKPYGLLNVGGYFSPLIHFFDHMVSEGFLKPEHRALVVVDDLPERLLDRLAAMHPAPTDKWIDPSTT